MKQFYLLVLFLGITTSLPNDFSQPLYSTTIQQKLHHLHNNQQLSLKSIFDDFFNPVQQVKKDEVSFTSLLYNFTSGLKVQSNTLTNITSCLDFTNSTKNSFLQSIEHYNNNLNYQASLNLTYSIQQFGLLVKHCLNAQLQTQGAWTTFSNQFLNNQHLFNSMNQTYISNLFTVSAISLSLIVNIKNAFWNVVAWQLGNLLDLTMKSVPVPYQLPPITQLSFFQKTRIYGDESQYQIIEYNLNKMRKNSIEFKNLLQVASNKSTDYIYYPDKFSDFTSTEWINFYKHFLFYANLVVDNERLRTCPPFYTAITTPLQASIQHFNNSIINNYNQASFSSGLYELSNACSFVHSGFVDCYQLQQSQRSHWQSLWSNIGANYLYWIPNIQNNQNQLLKMSTSIYSCLSVTDWQCISRMVGRIFNIIFTTL